MLYLYRITKTKWSKTLEASGYPARWNKAKEFVLYTADTEALACLENLVHRSGEGLNASFSLIKISVPKSVKIQNLNTQDLPKDWKRYDNYSKWQAIGSAWYQSKATCLLKVPSAITTTNSNFIINTLHPAFRKVKVEEVLPFYFDHRLKND